MIDNIILKKILDNFISGIAFIDQNRNIIYINNFFETITGLDKNSVLNKSVSCKFLQCRDKNNNLLCGENCPIEEAFTHQKIIKKECLIKNQIFGKFPVIISVFPIHINNEFSGVCFNIDDNAFKLLQSIKIDQLEQLAMLDELTGLPNRRFLRIFLGNCLSKLMRFPDYTLGLLFFDIDNFKYINDNFGHKFGDKVLKKLSDIIQKMLRKYDICSRYGGEEFIVVLPYLDNSNLERIAERLRSLVQDNLKFPSKGLSVTISIGATKAKKEDTIDSLIKRADELMYQSKLKGKNTITIG
jgi:diguanylate cyclase (GGDEF)-like protein/PAS domain S-box-containing protein